MNIFRRSPVREITVIEDVNENSLLVKQFKNLDIKIYGSHEEPLFKAKDIGDLLGIKDIKSSIRDFDENMSVIYSIHDTNGVKQEMIMLTEFGLYEVLFTSRKAIANEKFTSYFYQIKI